MKTKTTLPNLTLHAALNDVSTVFEQAKMVAAARLIERIEKPMEVKDDGKKHINLQLSNIAHDALNEAFDIFGCHVESLKNEE